VHREALKVSNCVSYVLGFLLRFTGSTTSAYGNTAQHMCGSEFSPSFLFFLSCLFSLCLCRRRFSLHCFFCVCVNLAVVAVGRAAVVAADVDVDVAVVVATVAVRLSCLRALRVCTDIFDYMSLGAIVDNQVR
jgi:hypothetical protein